MKIKIIFFNLKVLTQFSLRRRERRKVKWMDWLKIPNWVFREFFFAVEIKVHQRMRNALTAEWNLHPKVINVFLYKDYLFIFRNNAACLYAQHIKTFIYTLIASLSYLFYFLFIFTSFCFVYGFATK
jgi:hypothetical protein